MENNNLKFTCRVCLSNKIGNFKIKHFAFKPKTNLWKSFICFNCGAVSEFKFQGKETTYSDGAYRDKKSEDEKVLSPIDFWSAVSFKRWKHIWSILNESTPIFSQQNIKMLDYGGYNGFLPYALNQKHSISSFVADLDIKGLKMAEFLGSKIIDLSKTKINENNFDLITVVHVLEHLDTPKLQLEELKNSLSEEGVIYVEVPNLYGFPLSDEAHKIAFTLYSLAKLFKDSGLEVINYGYNSTPKESIRFDYYYNNEKENIPINISSFKYDLQISYAKIMLKSITLNLFKISLRYFRTFMLFLVYGLVEIITLKIFKISIVNKFLSKILNK